MIRISADSKFDFRSTEYNDLYFRANVTAFQHPIWLESIYTRLVKQHGAEPLIVTGRTHDNRLVFVLPLVRRRVGLFTLLDAADYGVSDYNQPVLDHEFLGTLEKQLAIASALRAALRPYSTLLRLRNIRGDAKDQLGIFNAYRTSLLGYCAHEVPLGAPFAVWRAETWDRSFTKYLDGKRKRLAKKGSIRFEEVKGSNSIERAFENLRAFRQVRWPDDALKNKLFFDFYVGIATEGSEAGLARTYALSVDGVVRGVLFGISRRERFMFLLLGFDASQLRNYSLGLLILENVIIDCIDRGQTVFDLTIGDEAYKQQFAAKPVPMLTAWAGERSIATVADLAFVQFLRLRALKRRVANFRATRASD